MTESRERQTWSRDRQRVEGRRPPSKAPSSPGAGRTRDSDRSGGGIELSVFSVGTRASNRLSTLFGRRSAGAASEASGQKGEHKKLKKLTAAALAEVITMPAVPYDVFISGTDLHKSQLGTTQMGALTETQATPEKKDRASRRAERRTPGSSTTPGSGSRGSVEGTTPEERVSAVRFTEATAVGKTPHAKRAGMMPITSISEKRFLALIENKGGAAPSAAGSGGGGFAGGLLASLVTPTISARGEDAIDGWRGCSS